jgi:serine O-acetyltransferase
MSIIEKSVSRENRILGEVLEKLLDTGLKGSGGNQAERLLPYPSRRKILSLSKELTEILLPEYFCLDRGNKEVLQFHVGHLLARVSSELKDQIGLALENDLVRDKATPLPGEEVELTELLIGSLPQIRSLLLKDAEFALQKDPAARSIDEIMLCYPGFRALMYHRIAHQLYRMSVPLIPRIISEHSHSETGIDIHPGATLEAPVFMDHGTGIVIGETCRLGKRVTLYQGVTLGAKSFPTNDRGEAVKGIKRHPIVEDDVVIYSGATILGRITIGHGSVIGGNVWVTRDVDPQSRILQSPGRQQRFANGEGI